TSASTTVNRLRFRSARPEAPSDELIPPPNMSDRPPPRPLWSRISRVSRRLVIPSSTCRLNVRNGTVCTFQAIRMERTRNDYTEGSDPDMLLVADDRGELVHDDRRTADESTVDIGLAHEGCDVRRLHRTAVQDAGLGRGIRPQLLPD